LEKLSESIKKITKSSYYNNKTKYSSHFGDFTDLHKLRIDNGIYPMYHEDIILNKTHEFTLKIYQQKKDPCGNDVYFDKELNFGRITYWVKSIQI
jgi:hypothetical protein